SHELVDERGPEPVEMRRTGVGVGVLRLEVRDHLGVGLLAHPLERIDHGVPAAGPFGGSVRGGGGGGGRGDHPPRGGAPSSSGSQATPSTRGSPAEPGLAVARSRIGRSSGSGATRSRSCATQIAAQAGDTSMPSSEVQAKTAGYSPSGTFSAGL